mmetsp:Transcript_52500/g.60046  ORF Transcript_52500/g.60046 Transcript_52500/m.60046 type:complete len:842 (+) Transcript_52500:284-2809(+)
MLMEQNIVDLLERDIGRDHPTAHQIDQEETDAAPEVARALHWFDLTSLRYRDNNGNLQKYPVCATRLKFLGKYGTGLQLYFTLIRRLTYLFFFITIAGTVAMYSNWRGEYWDAESSFGVSSKQLGFANQYGYSLEFIETNTFTTTQMEDMLDKQKEEQNLLLMSAYAVWGLVVIFIHVHKRCSKKETRENLRNNITAGDYAIEVKGLPPDALGEDIAEHFAQFGEIAEVSIARKYGESLHLFKKQATLRKKREILTVRRKIYEDKGLKVRKFDKAICQLNDRILALNQKIAKKYPDLSYHEELPLERAYVVFQSVRSRNHCMKKYRKDNLMCCPTSLCQSERLRFKGHHLRVKQAVEPSNILWENLEVSRSERCRRGFVIFFCVFLLLVCSFVIIFLIKVNISDDDINKTTCEPISSTIPKTQEEAEAINDSGDLRVKCYCFELGYTTIAQNPSLINGICEDYAKQKATAYFAQFLSAASIIVINGVLRYFLRRLGRYQRYETITRETTSTLKKIFIASFINTAFIPIIIYASLQNYGFVSTLSEIPYIGEYFLNEGYTDLTREWHLKVPPAVNTFMVWNLISPHFLMVILGSISMSCSRRKGRKRANTQVELNRAYEGLPFDVGTNVAYTLNLFFVTLFFGPALPTLYPLAFLCFLIKYWSDKYFALRLAKKPPNYDERINDTVLSLLPFSLLLFTCATVITYGAPDIWPLEYDAVSGQVTTVKDTSFGNRFYTRVGAPYTTLLTVTFIYFFVVRKFLGSILKAICTSKKVFSSEKQGDYLNELATIKMNGLHTYHIINNANYSGIVTAMDEYANEQKSDTDKQKLNFSRETRNASSIKA